MYVHPVTSGQAGPGQDTEGGGPEARSCGAHLGLDGAAPSAWPGTVCEGEKCFPRRSGRPALACPPGPGPAHPSTDFGVQHRLPGKTLCDPEAGHTAGHGAQFAGFLGGWFCFVFCLIFTVVRTSLPVPSHRGQSLRGDAGGAEPAQPGPGPGVNKPLLPRTPRGTDSVKQLRGCFPGPAVCPRPRLAAAWAGSQPRRGRSPPSPLLRAPAAARAL